jgi:NADPH-dependent 2,4-dienoyl-CoA reductase/sulfur reductase-like enzyme/predicted acylesterase/phospholipase RssA
MTRKVDFLLVGGGLASATAAETLRLEGADGTIAILSAEAYPPYQRPPLSTQFLLGTQTEDRLPIFDDSFYREHSIDVILSTRATHLDGNHQVVQTDRAGEVRFRKLLIATGAAPMRFQIPGSTLPGIHYLRTLADALNIRRSAESATRAVVVGGSFLAIELAASLGARGIHVTLVAMEKILLDKLKSQSISDFFNRYYREHGVEIVLGDQVIGFLGEAKIEGVRTRSGKTLPCDLALVAIGVAPEVEFLQGSGIEVDDGIVVDRYLRTNLPDIFAAGDVANFFDPVFNIRRRIEHWDNAVKQGRLAAKNMLGQRVPYDEVSYFFCDVFDITFDFFGYPEIADEKIARGSLDDRTFALFYLKGEVPRALFSLGRPAQETKTVEALIRYRVNLHAIRSKLSDPQFRLEQIPTQNILVLQGGGALGAFECGVVKALEERGIYPDIVAGVSIGAFNAAVIAGNPKNPSAALEDFWHELEIVTPEIPDEPLRRILSSWTSLAFGSPKFFHPKWFTPLWGLNQLPLNWTSFYDPSPVRRLLAKYVDFTRLRTSPIRLIVSAVNVQTAQLEIFDSYVDDLTPDHILASGSLPPGFPWTTIDGKHYWDGGIVSNSPLEDVIERCGPAGKRVFIVDLFPGKKELPVNIIEVMSRRDEIVYSERIRNDLRMRNLLHDFRRLVEEILVEVSPDRLMQIKQRPRYIQLMGDIAPTIITRVVREMAENEPLSKDYDFSTLSIELHKQSGYSATLKALNSSLNKVWATSSKS